MKLGETEVETLRLNNWGVGDILEGKDANGWDRIVITAIGNLRFLCRWDYGCNNVYSEEIGNTTLSSREWRFIGNIYTHESPQPKPLTFDDLKSHCLLKKQV